MPDAALEDFGSAAWLVRFGVLRVFRSIVAPRNHWLDLEHLTCTDRFGSAAPAVLTKEVQAGVDDYRLGKSAGAGLGGARSVSEMPLKTNGLRSATSDHCSGLPWSSRTSHTRVALPSLTVTTRVPSGLNAALSTMF